MKTKARFAGHDGRDPLIRWKPLIDPIVASTDFPWRVPMAPPVAPAPSFASARAGIGGPVRRALAVAAAVILAACGGGGDPVQVEPTGSIRGTVTDQTGATIADAAVALTGNAQAARTANSGADGVYTFANVPPGTYTLAVTPPAGFTVGAAGTASVMVAGGAQADASAFVLHRMAADSCSGARPDFGGAATAGDRNLFSYDVDAPLNLQKTVESTNEGVEVSSIAFGSPGGGMVTGMMWDPVTRSSLRPGMVLMHGMPGTARDMSGIAQSYARHGAVVVAIDAPFARRAGPPVRFTDQDRAEQIQLVKELQRAVDVLRSRPNVDDGRIAYMGVSYGGAMGALFVGIERRLEAAALVVGHGGLVSHSTGPEGFKYISGLPCAVRVAWIRAMAPIEPVRFVGNANMPLLLQNGMSDALIPGYEAAELHAAAPQPRTVLWYSAGHNLNQQAVLDRHGWLVDRIGLDAAPTGP
jgi:dienelactone hydrolase